MIKANELRLGNWFYSNIYQQVDLQHLEYLLNENFAPYNAMSPIPLTPEILEKAGFVKTVNEDDFDIWRNRIELWQHDEGFCHSYAFGGDVKCVHQLQNLYFTLTGEELEIKL